ncbi:cellulase (glycosyl hydrolase family 5) subfamily protein, partial [Chrysochromulina tobinii]
MVPQGLGNHSLDYYLTFLQQHSFNGIRLPFDHDRMLRNAIVVDSHHVRLAPELLHLRYVNVFTTIAKAAARRGQLIVLACDRLTFSAAPGQPGSGLWYSGEVSEEQVQRSWAHIADVLCSQWNVIGVDLQSQPFRASWDSPGKGPPTFNPATDWNAAATRLGNFVLSKCPRWLVFVEGVGETPGARDQQLEGGAFWGENLWGARQNPIKLSTPSHLVYSPVAYGPSVYGAFSYFQQPSFPANMDKVWQAHFGFVQAYFKGAIVFASLGD